jgi:hypothetical protein
LFSAGRAELFFLRTTYPCNWSQIRTFEREKLK